MASISATDEWMASISAISLRCGNEAVAKEGKHRDKVKWSVDLGLAWMLTGVQ
jgi:hypothetical protein